MNIANTKVVIIGAGMVGASTAYSLVVQGTCAEVILIDRNYEKAYGEALDLKHSIEFLGRNVRVKAGYYGECADADIVVITASIPMVNISSRNELLDSNIGVMAEVTDSIMASGFDGHIIVVSNPVDILSYYVWKRSGLPSAQVIGTGTSLETARLKTLLGDIVNLDPRSVSAYVIGEHGETMTVPWTHVQVGGKMFVNALRDNPERFKEVDLEQLVEDTSKVGFEVYNRKGSTQYGIASAVCWIIESILHDERRMISVSAYLDGEYGEEDVYCGVPAIIGKEGVIEIAEYHLSQEEKAKFHKSTEAVRAQIQRVAMDDEM